MFVRVSNQHCHGWGDLSMWDSMRNYRLLNRNCTQQMPVGESFVTPHFDSNFWVVLATTMSTHCESSRIRKYNRQIQLQTYIVAYSRALGNILWALAMHVRCIFVRSTRRIDAQNDGVLFLHFSLIIILFLTFEWIRTNLIWIQSNAWTIMAVFGRILMKNALLLKKSRDQVISVH